MTPTELQLRHTIALLLKVIERLCDEFCKKAYRIPEYNEAKRLLDEQP
jgi:hypothetical protein